jgi:hypothetical protein
MLGSRLVAAEKFHPQALDFTALGPQMGQLLGDISVAGLGAFAWALDVIALGQVGQLFGGLPGAGGRP